MSFPVYLIIYFFVSIGNFETHKKFKSGKRIWQRLAKALETEEISVECLNHVKSYKTELSMLLAYLDNNSEDQHDYRKQKNLKIIENLVKKESIIRQKLSLLESAIKFASEINPAQIPRVFNEKKENLETKKLKDLNDNFWGPLLPLLALSSELEPVMNSVSFKNVAMICLSENRDWTSDDSDTDRLHSLLQCLTTHALKRFKFEWQVLCDDPDSQTFETMKILAGLRSEEHLIKELSILEIYLKTLSIPEKLHHYMFDYVRYESVVKQVGNILQALDVFQLRDSDNNVVAILTKFENDFKHDGSICLQDLHGPMSKVRQIICDYLNETNDDVIGVLGKSRELIGFLKGIMNVDVTLLIDAVEEHSDQFVSESLVSELIHVHGFLSPVFEICQNSASHQLPQDVLQKLKDQCEDHEDMATKIDQCNQHVHSLKQLYQSLANRGEVTRDVIASCLARGKVDVSLDKDGTCKIHMKYMKKNEEEAIYILSDLHDLRSRAHLITTSDRTRKHTLNKEELMDTSIDFAEFIEQVNILCEIEELILKLRASGYIKYRTIDERTMSCTEQLQQMKDELLKEWQIWEECLYNARQQHYLLNFYWSDQLCVLYDFLTNPNRNQVDFKDVITLIHFVDPNIDDQDLREYGESFSNNHQNTSRNTPYEITSVIGNALDELFKDKRFVKRTILETETSSPPQQYDTSTVQPGELYVATLPKETSAQSVNVVLSLYQKTSNTYPEPSQIVFCDQYKQWEEIQLLMRRCFNLDKDLGQKSLFCLTNVELLENEVQFRLVEFIKENQKNNRKYLLAIVCGDGDHHHIVEEFSQFSHRIPGMSYLEVSQRFQFSWPDVKFVTSPLPGLGKTEFIRQDALEKGMNVVTFPISGQLDQVKIIQRLKQLDLKDFQCLHFDIGDVEDPVLLDTFLFQLIVTGMVSCGTQLYSLPNTPVYIEIANSLNDRLRESLVITQCFTRIELKWKNYDNLKVSSKITSDLQVVCHYLNVLERDRLELTDIRFSGAKKVKPLSANRCRELLRKYYSTGTDVTFTALNTFLGLLADQLRKFSKSSFFRTNNIKYMIGKKANGIRKNLFEALLDVSKKFAARALKTTGSRDYSNAAHSNVYAMTTTAERMIERVEEMIHWENSNHLLIVFHGNDSQAITAVYRKKDDVPNTVSDLLTNQIVKGETKELDDYSKMTQDKLHEKLEKIARKKSHDTNVTDSTKHKYSGYVLTPDNMLKMILIILRVRANVPVIIMGETGCGKTSLIKYLANTCNIPIHTFNIHAGRSEEEIKSFVKKRDKEANETSQSIWVFLDEINTCNHLGLINEILCHHSMDGQPLATNLVFLAACNPYEKRAKDRIETAGLEMNDLMDDYSELVYRVHPLPEAMIDYVWDYGSLTSQDEKAYIQKMAQQISLEYKNVLVDILAESQEFIRKSEENRFCVSLRDVRRCIILIEWFMDIIKKRSVTTDGGNGFKMEGYLANYRKLAEEFDDKPVVKSIILALGHCYLSRLETDELRSSYLARMTHVFSSRICINEETFSAIIRMEQEEYLCRMELPQGTAKNAALRENVFVMLVSILNRIPVFVVGKPGCSKSLAIQLIRSNLRGKDSKDPFFQTLPQLYVVSYQGSKSSTSEGINKIFEKASNYKDHNKDTDVLPVVLLDEVGLAENSPNNPLKVLHSILEPGKGKLPDVAVVGISNWALDAAKMNRAIHLSRPEPTPNDLEETAISLYRANVQSERELDASTKNVLNCLANAYHEYQSKQERVNFHGLRDYYSLVKSLRADSCKDMNEINVALKRNFGGIPVELSNVQPIFMEKLKMHVPTSGKDVSIPVTTLIQENLYDFKARHLMLITNSDSAIGILKQNLWQSEKETITIFGSRFEEDMSDDYNYRMLSRIILCMERDCILILRDLECIYGSLYDMLNQNYSVVGKRKNCRVALGANSNPMCYVNDGFRCIVLVDYDKVDYSDPPFLNRFEKQLLRFSDVLNVRQRGIIAELHTWVYEMSSVEDLEERFKESDMFMGFHEDTLPSLVLLHSNDTNEPNEDIVRKCKDDLMWIATPDGVLRTQRCKRIKEDSHEVTMLAKDYFEKPIHNGLAFFMKKVVNDQEFAYSTGDEVGSKIIVMTHATVHTDITQCLDGSTLSYQLERLGAYNAEKQLEDRIHDFFFVSDKELLVFQCKPEFDSEHMLLARSVIEDKRNSYVKTYEESNSTKQRKHVCIVVHVRRGGDLEAKHWKFNHLCGWKQVFLDVVEEPLVPMTEIRSKSIDSLLASSNWSFEKFSKDSKCLLWCFTCLKYIKQQIQFEVILEMANRLLESEKVFETIENIVYKYVHAITAENNNRESWPVSVACDKESLINSSTFSCAIEYYLFRLVRDPLAKIIYFLERENAWPSHLSPSRENALPDYEDVWCELIVKDTILDLSTIPAPLGTESYIIDGVRLQLSVPFSQVIIRKVNVAKEQVLREQKSYRVESEEHDQASKGKQMERYKKIVQSIAPDILHLPERYLNQYSDDFLDVTLASFSEKMTRQQRISIGKCGLLSFANDLSIYDRDPLHFCIQYHLLMWNFGQQIIDQIRLINSCELFVDHSVVDTQIRAFLQEEQSSGDFSEPIDSTGFSESHISTDETSTHTDDENEPSENRNSSLKRKYEHSQQLENHRDDSPRKRGKYQNKLKSDSNQLCTEMNDDDKADPNNDLGQSSTFRENDETESSSGDSETSDEEESSSDSSDSKSSVSDEELETDLVPTEMNDVVKDCFEDILVTKFCEHMFPSKHNVERNGGLESWIRNSSLLLSLAFNVSKEAPAFHFLRLCVDYAKVVAEPNIIQEDYLYVLDEIAIELKPEYLDKDGSLQKLTEKLVNPLKKQLELGKEKDVVLQKFLATFYSRFIDTYEDAESAVPIVENVLSIDRDDLVLLMKPVIYSLLFACQMESQGIFFDIIINSAAMNNHPILKGIDAVFRKRFSQKYLHHDSYPAVLICDIIFSILMADERCTIEKLTDHECELLRCLRCATKSLDGGEKNIGLTFLSSVSFLRVFYTKLSKHINENRKNIPVMSEINSLLSVGGATRSSIQIFFLKQLYGLGMTMFDLCKFCGDTGQLPVFKNQLEQCKIVNKVELVSIYRLAEYGEVKAAYEHLTQKNEGEMVTILTKCKNSANHRLALLGILINMFYVRKAVCNLSEKEERLVNWFCLHSNDLPSPLKKLLMRIIGRENFHHSGLRISVQSSNYEIETALLILHILSVVASCTDDEISPLLLYFLSPEKCHRTYLLAHGEDRKHRVFDEFSIRNEPLPVTCSCGLRIKHKDDHRNWCPYCKTEIISNNCKTTTPQLMKKWDECIESMDASAYRALHFIVYACLYGGVATGISSNEAVSLLLQNDKRGTNLEETGEYSADFCLNRMREDLQCLMTILSCKRRPAVDVMHLVVEQCTKLLRGKILSKHTFSTQEECVEWETKFTSMARRAFPNAIGSQRPLKELRIEISGNAEKIQREINECDEYPSHFQQQNVELKRLFRVTKQASFTELRSMFLNSFKDFQEQHGVLAILLSKFDELPYLACLYPLLRWSRLVSLTLTHRISRKEARSTIINDFIEDRLSPQRTVDEDEAKKLFNDFKDAWNKMREFVNQNLDQDEMPHLTELSFIGYCLTEGDLSIYLRKAIKILQAIQNNILDEMIITSARTGHSALSFLEKNETCCAMMSISLQEAGEKDIINFNWPDEFLKCAQMLDYGQGEKIVYDFEKMEKELANEIVFGKCYLKDFLNPFIFSKELFHASANMLTTICAICPQRQLPDEMRQGINSLKRKLQDAQNLLQYIEIVIFVLSISPFQIHEEMTVVEFAGKLKSKIPNSLPVDLLPEPRSSIRLTHIAALYEALEDLLVDGAIEGLPGQFRKKLTDETNRSLNVLVSESKVWQLKQFLTALRRFVFRYLSAEKFLPESRKPLRSCLSEPSLWSGDHSEAPNLAPHIPEEMMLENIHAIITRLQQVCLLPG